MGQPRLSRPDGLSTDLRKSSQMTETTLLSENLRNLRIQKKKIRFHRPNPL
jgi:hypothetical protein